eukprot:GHVS01072653.1.p1 GENE.GHVS01072653.1~~GHVS01072653.1.p1  ORF type:complete len:273 (-),score=27.32 GHVS01072653.1:1087-1833(-)
MYAGIFCVWPIRFLLFAVGGSLIVIVQRIAGFVFLLLLTLSSSKTMKAFQDAVLDFIGRYGALYVLAICGVVTIREHLPSSPPAKCVVSNHLSTLDVMYFMWSLYPSFVAKDAVNTNIFVGAFARHMRCLFVDRTCTNGREEASQAIAKRQVELDSGNNCQLPSLVIFPEGTTSNGTTILPFKQGAFRSLVDISPVVLVYRCPFVSVAYELIPTLWWFPIVLSSVGNSNQKTIYQKTIYICGSHALYS